MLVQFSVRNFRSFKNEACLSLLADKKEDLENNVSKINENTRLLNSISIYGANAAGKSNLIKALTTSILMIRQSNLIQVTNKWVQLEPFFDNESRSLPTDFEYIFFIDTIKYIYGFSATKERIHKEYLYEYKTNRPSVVFERDLDVFTFNQDKKDLSLIAERNTSNKLFLSTAAAWNFERVIPVYKWFENNINTFGNVRDASNYSFSKYDEDFQANKNFALQLLREGDINISDFNIETIPVDEKQIPFFNNFNIKVDGATQKKVTVEHFIELDNGNSTSISLDLTQESEGTENIFLLAPVLLDALEKGSSIFIDEIERSLHPVLIKHIISYFHDEKTNPNKAQLIFTTHNLELMDLEIFRRDQIYFVDKNTKTAQSEIYSLDEYSVRKNENVKNGYLLGRFGAIPNI